MTWIWKPSIKTPCLPEEPGPTRPGEAQVGGSIVSIVRIGLAETKNFSSGYDAIFGGKPAQAKKDGGKGKARQAGRAKAKAGKKKKK